MCLAGWLSHWVCCELLLNYINTSFILHLTVWTIAAAPCCPSPTCMMWIFYVICFKMSPMWMKAAGKSLPPSWNGSPQVSHSQGLADNHSKLFVVDLEQDCRTIHLHNSPHLQAGVLLPVHRWWASLSLQAKTQQTSRIRWIHLKSDKDSPLLIEKCHLSSQPCGIEHLHTILESTIWLKRCCNDCQLTTVYNMDAICCQRADKLVLKC